MKAAAAQEVEASPIQAAERFENLLIGQVFESRLNPRKTFNEQYMNDLTASIRAKGVTTPILVRPSGDRFEIVYGACRYRCSIRAGKPTIPVMIRELLDVEVLELQLIENIIRQDMTPMEEADGYARLIELGNYTPELIAEKTGKDVKTILQRLRYADLAPEARKLLEDGEINIGHANLLARLPAEQQAKAIKFLKVNYYQGNHSGSTVCSVADFDKHIRTNIYLDLSGAQWKKDDAELLPKAGACTTCPKRTGAHHLLFDDVAKNDMCLDGACFTKKADLHLVNIQATAEAAGEKLVRVSVEYYMSDQQKKKLNTLTQHDYEEVKGKLGCDLGEWGIYIDGPRRSQKVRICRDPKCAQHKGKHSAARRPHAETAAAKRQRELQLLNRNIECAVLRAQLAAVLDPSKCLMPSKKKPVFEISFEVMRVLASTMQRHAEASEELATALGFDWAKAAKDYNASDREWSKAIADPKGTAHLGRMVIGLAIEEAALDHCGAATAADLQRLCKEFNVDAAAIKASITKEMRAAAKPKPVAKKKAAANKKGPSKKAAAKKSPAKKAAKRKGGK